jgi:acyl carrier protein
MNSRRELLTRLRPIIREQLGVEEHEITENATWEDLGADSLDRIEMSLAIERASNVDIPHPVGELLHTVGDTVDYLLGLTAAPRDNADIRIEAVTTNQQWAELLAIRTRVFTMEYGFSFKPLPGPVERGLWHFLARDNQEAVGTLSVIDTTGDRQVHQQYRLAFGENERSARYTQLAILPPYRKRGIFEMLIEAAQQAVIRPNGFTVGWLLYPAARAHSCMLTRNLGFSAEKAVLQTEFGECYVLIQRPSTEAQGTWSTERVPVIRQMPAASGLALRRGV